MRVVLGACDYRTLLTCSLVLLTGLLCACNGGLLVPTTGAGDDEKDVYQTASMEICDNQIDDDLDGLLDCLDDECQGSLLCVVPGEICFDGHDNDGDGAIDCADADCPACVEDCGNDADDDADGLIDCDDPDCGDSDPRCKESCGDGIDNDAQRGGDCQDADCSDVDPSCGDPNPADGSECSYGGAEPHTCACADGVDNDGDGHIDSEDLNCFGPFDDDEDSYATGIPGDNMGAHGYTECPFDGNSGTGNDDICCNPEDPSQNVTPNGCDNVGCCEIDLNSNSTGEHVLAMEGCVRAPPCGTDGTHGCPCTSADACDTGQSCVADDDTGPGFCSRCKSCEPDPMCANRCECGEICYGGFEQPVSICGSTTPDAPSCADALAPCPQGDADCDGSANQRCVNGCCYRVCAEGVTPCQTSNDCPQELDFYCLTGCCIEASY